MMRQGTGATKMLACTIRMRLGLEYVVQKHGMEIARLDKEVGENG